MKLEIERLAYDGKVVLERINPKELIRKLNTEIL